MSSVNQPGSTIQQRVQTALGRWRGTLASSDRELFEAFVQHALMRLQGPFMAQHHPTQVLRHLERAFEFALNRQEDEVKVSVRGGDTKGVIAMSLMPDQPFIVDTIRLFFRRHDADYWGGFHLVIHAQRDENGRLISVGGEGISESVVLLEADVGELIYDLPGAAQKLSENLALASAMVADFRQMTRAIERAGEKFETAADRSPERAAPWQETAAFLQWLLRENFVFMGVEQGSSEGTDDKLGIQTLDSRFYNDARGVWPTPHASANIQVRKGMCESPVHRAGRIDEIMVRLPAQWDDRILLIRGMFTYRAVTQPSRNVPILRRLLANILTHSDSKPGSFRYKGIANVFDSLPTEFLFTATEDAISQMVQLVFESEQQQEVGVTYLMLGPQSAFSLIAMPKSQFSDEMRRDLQEEIVNTVQATYSDHGLFVGRYETVLLYYYLTGVTEQGPEALQDLSERIRALATPWIAQLWQSLSNRFDAATADRLADTYGSAFPPDWVRTTPSERAVQDILILESLGGRRTPSADVYATRSGQLMLRLYEPVDLYLTEVLPVLDNFGLVVHDAYATDVHSRGGHLRMDSFRLAPLDAKKSEDLLACRSVLIDAIEAVFADEVETDNLNSLVLRAGLTWKEVDVIRGYQRYMRQLHLKVAQTRVQELLLAKFELVSHLIALFRARFDPDLEGDREVHMQAASDLVDDHLRRIRTHDEDLVFGTLASLIRGTLRTNFYREDKPFHYLSFKFDCQNMKEFAGARHKYEIYVHNKDVEGVHIRFGPVSRGGLRWSDRDDFRTEILGLASTQQKKNVVIVPEGSKGGFRLRNPPANRDERRAEGDRCYETLIRGMLDLTDNAVGGHTEHPLRVVCHDGMDPYLVVAADKGTAHLSDTANRISRSYGYWLDDAFASGGSNGYDHKKVGITARGAWVLVRRHFAEAGIDPYSTSFTCAGVGDMGGDVFGNGLIETPHTRLLAAFNHMHIFLDPDPNPEASFAERSRLFKVAGRAAGWDNYNTDILSEGGGIFDRSEKTIPLSPQVQAMLGLEQDEAPPDLI
ncbi:MAG: glutamate dehydrogenase, partial [Kiritimatiellia bacterium]